MKERDKVEEEMGVGSKQTTEGKADKAPGLPPFFLALLEEPAKPRSALGSQYFTQRRHKRMVEVHADKRRVP